MLLCLDWTSTLYVCENCSSTSIGLLDTTWRFAKCLKVWWKKVAVVDKPPASRVGSWLELEFIMVTTVAEVYQNWMSQLKAFLRFKIWFFLRSVVGTKTIQAPLIPVVVACVFVKVDLKLCTMLRWWSFHSSAASYFPHQRKHRLFLTVTPNPHIWVYLQSLSGTWFLGNIWQSGPAHVTLRGERRPCS